jgi:hypothetical protein
VGTCPKCGSNIPARKLLLLTRFSATITCPTCASELQWKNKGTGSLIGGVGGGVGGGLVALFGIWWLQTGSVTYLGLIVGVFAAVFFAAWMAMVKFAKFEPKSL